MQQYKDNNLTLKDMYDQDVLDAMFKTEGEVMAEVIHPSGV